LTIVALSSSQRSTKNRPSRTEVYKANKIRFVRHASCKPPMQSGLLEGTGIKLLRNHALKAIEFQLQGPNPCAD
jgi:hypothetical protein